MTSPHSESGIKFSVMKKGLNITRKIPNQLSTPKLHYYLLITDIDECDREGAGEYPCDDDKEYCANSKGSYKCMKCDPSCDKCLGEGNGMCVKCKEGYQTEEGKCIGKLIDFNIWATQCLEFGN